MGRINLGILNSAQPVPEKSLEKSLLPLLATVLAGALATPAMAEDEFPGDLAARDGAIVLKANGPWNIDFGANKCRLARLFGQDDNSHLLFFEQASPGGGFGVSLAGPEVSRFRNANRIFMGMERDEPMTAHTEFRRGDIASIGPAIIFATYAIGRDGERPALSGAGIDLGEAATIDRVVMRRGRHVLSFETGDMMPPFQALNTCTQDLLRDWGLDPEQHAAYTRPRWINEEAIVRRIVDQYPSRARAFGEQAIFRMRAIVEIDGSVSDCHLENSTETRRLESPACREMMDARFEPARDADGNPMRSFYGTAITYRIGR